MAPHSSTLAWKIPWTEEPGRLQTMGSRRVGHDWATSLSLSPFMHWRRRWQPTPVFLAGESQGRGSLVGRRLWGRRVGHDWSDLAAAVAAEKEKTLTLIVCFLLPLKGEIKNVLHLQPISRLETPGIPVCYPLMITVYDAFILGQLKGYCYKGRNTHVDRLKKSLLGLLWL